MTWGSYYVLVLSNLRLAALLQLKNVSKKTKSHEIAFQLEQSRGLKEEEEHIRAAAAALHTSL